VLVALVALVVPATYAGSGGSGGCEQWNCRFADDGTASCWWATFGGNLAMDCKVVCDRGSTGGGCWCEYPGQCYMI
jgi:hypothetical protein